MNLPLIMNHLHKSLTLTILQDMSDKMFTLHTMLKKDGKGLCGGMLMEYIVQETFQQSLDRFEDYHFGQGDMKIMDCPISFKKITGKSELALNWSKNNSETSPCFQYPILLMNLKEGKWWRNKPGFDRFVQSGFFLVDHNFCNETIVCGRNNKTDTLIGAEYVYRMICHAYEDGLFLPLPPPRTDRYIYTVMNGFQERKVTKKPTHVAVQGLRFADLFCGVGGFHQALSSLGHTCVYACDIDDDCRQVYNTNYGFNPDGDIRSVDEKNVPPFDILCAGFPCTPFSKAGDQDGFQDQTKGQLFWHICRFLRHHHPPFLILENVKNILTHDQGRTWSVICKELTGIGYTVRPLVVSPLHVGTPQTRERTVIVGTYNKPLPEFPDYHIQPTCVQSILGSDAEGYRLQGKHHNTGMIWEEFCGLLKSRSIGIPRFPLWTDWWDRVVDPDDSLYKKYRNWIDKNRIFFQEHADILTPWLQKARADPLWHGSMRKLEWQCDAKSLKECLWTFRGSGVRVRNLDYTPTLVAMSMIPVYGPEWRWLTPREVCRLQDFPEEYVYRNDRTCYKQMGNAVNVKVIREVAKVLLSNA